MITVPPVPWFQALEDFARPLRAIFDELGEPPVDVWFGAHFPDVDPPADAVLFQTEVAGSKWFTPRYLEKLARARAVWDYSAHNRSAYECRRWAHVPLRYHPCMERPWLQRMRKLNPPGESVGFFGSINERRHRLLTPNVERMPVLWGIARTEWLSRVRTIVAPHYYEGGPAEQARLSVLLANAIPVVAERAPDESNFPGPYYTAGTNLINLAGHLGAQNGEFQREAYRANGTGHDAVRAAIDSLSA